MKNRIFIILAAFFLMLSCTKEYLDVNKDPSGLESADPKLLLTACIVKNAYNSGSELSIMSSIFTNYVRGVDRQALSFSNYVLSAGDFDNLWGYGFYHSALKSSYDLKSIANSKNQPHYQAIGEILLAMGIIQASDVWGDIPYSEAFKGLDKVDPIFDKQESVYAAAEALLNNAITLLDGPNGGVAISSSADILYGGNTANWKKFAYGLKARNAIHLSKIQGTAAYQKAIDAANLSFTSSSENAKVSFVSGVYNSAPWYQFNVNRGDIEVHESFIAKLDAISDPRKDFLVNPTTNMVGSAHASATSPVVLMSYDEIKFILAEAKKQLGQSPTSDFMTAVSENVKRITGSDNSAFVSSVTSDESIENIMLQKHIAMFTTLEGWNDYRRTNLPALTPNVGSQMPRSFFYSAKEQQANKNTPANTTIFRKVWWDL